MFVHPKARRCRKNSWHEERQIVGEHDEIRHPRPESGEVVPEKLAQTSLSFLS